MLSLGLEIVAMLEPMKSAYTVHSQIAGPFATAWDQKLFRAMYNSFYICLCVSPLSAPIARLLKPTVTFLLSFLLYWHPSLPHYSSLHQISSDLWCSSWSIFDCSNPQLKYVLMCLYWEVIDELRPQWLFYSGSIPAFPLHLTASY